MWFTLLAVAIGLTAGYVAGGSHANLRYYAGRLPLLPVLWATGFAVTDRTNVPHAFIVLVVAYCCFALFVGANISRVKGIWVLGIGVALNMAVLLSNHATPFRTSSLRAAGLHEVSAGDVVRTTAVSRPERSGDRLLPLADIVPLNAGPLREVLSIGDVFIALGMSLVVFQALQPPRTITARSATTRSATARSATARSATTRSATTRAATTRAPATAGHHVSVNVHADDPHGLDDDLLDLDDQLDLDLDDLDDQLDLDLDLDLDDLDLDDPELDDRDLDDLLIDLAHHHSDDNIRAQDGGDRIDNGSDDRIIGVLVRSGVPIDDLACRADPATAGDAFWAARSEFLGVRR